MVTGWVDTGKSLLFLFPARVTRPLPAAMDASDWGRPVKIHHPTGRSCKAPKQSQASEGFVAAPGLELLSLCSQSSGPSPSS